MSSSFERIMIKEKAEGKAESVIELLEAIGEPFEILINCIMGQTDMAVLGR